MSEPSRSTSARPGLPPAEALAVLVVAAVFVGKLWVALVVGLDPDEGYYTLWSQYLAAGYLDHPPGVGLMIAAGRTLAGDTPLGIRLLPLLLSLMVSAAIFRTGRLLFPASAAAAVAVVWYNLTLLATINFVATPDAPSTLFWVLGIWVAAEWLASGKPLWWLAFGLLAGLGLASKYTNAFLGPGILAFLVADRAGRREFFRWPLWAGAGLALLVFLPVLLWNAQHEWRSFLFQGSRVTAIDTLGGWLRFGPDYLWQQAVLVGPVLFALFIAGCVFCVRRPGERRGLGLLVLTTLPLVGYFLFHALHARVEQNWTSPIVPAMSLIAAWVVTTPGRAEGWKRFALWLQPLLGAALVGLVYVQGIAHPFNLGELDRTAKLRDWDGLAVEARRLADQTHASRILADSGYQLTGELFAYGLFAHDPRPVRDLEPHIRYDFLPATSLPAGPALVVVEAPEAPPGAGRLVGSFTRLAGGPGARRYDFYLLPP